MRWLVILASFAVLLFPSSPLSARTIHVPGDVPTIAAGLLGAQPGDSVLVAEGTYNEWNLLLPRGVVLTSESGAVNTIIDGTGSGVADAILAVWNGGRQTEVSGFTFRNFVYGLLIYNSAPVIQENVFRDIWDFCINMQRGAPLVRGNLFLKVGGGVWATSEGDAIEVRSNTFVEVVEAVIFGMDASSALITGNIVVNGFAGIVYAGYTTSYTLSCNDVWGNSYADYWGFPFNPLEQDGNISLDPLFCNAEAGDFTLDAQSPCLPDHHPGPYRCELIGLYGMGCGDPTAVEKVTWGQAKAFFR